MTPLPHPPFFHISDNGKKLRKTRLTAQTHTFEFERVALGFREGSKGLKGCSGVQGSVERVKKGCSGVQGMVERVEGLLWGSVEGSKELKSCSRVQGRVERVGGLLRVPRRIERVWSSGKGRKG